MKTFQQLMEEERANRIELFKDIFSAKLKARGKELVAKNYRAQIGVCRKHLCELGARTTRTEYIRHLQLTMGFSYKANELFPLDEFK